MNRTPRSSLAALATALLFSTALHGQITLTGTSYSEGFNSLSSGLPAGWAVYTGATSSTLGAVATFNTTTTAWNASNSSGVFRNISSDNILASSGSSTQAANADRAIGFRPVDVTSGDTSARQGSVTLALSNTLGFENFSLSVSLFTGNDVTNTQSYALEYRVGSSGSFTSIGTYSTGSVFSATTLTADSITLSALNNQADTVYFRIRGTSATGTGNLDTLGIDDFNLNYSASAIPEPSTYASIAGGVMLAAAIWHRRRKRQTSS